MEISIFAAMNVARTQPIEAIEYNLHAPLNTIINYNQNISLNQGRSTNLPIIRRLIPTSLTRLSMHESPLLTIDKEVLGSALQSFQPTSMSSPRQSSLKAHIRRRGGKEGV